MTVRSITTLRPGLLVALKTSLTGTMSYSKTITEAPREIEGVGEQAKWETTRVIRDREEHELGRKTQAAVRASVTKICINTAFGLLCPEAERPALDKAVNDARQLAREFNDQARISKLTVYVIAGKVSPDDVEAAKAMNSEVERLIRTMQEGIRNADPEAIREAANEARKIGEMLSADASGRVQVAIETGRRVARELKKAGEEAAVMVDQVAIARLEECRTLFLDLDGGTEVAAPQDEGRAVDLIPEGGWAVREMVTVTVGQLDLEDAIAEEK